MLVSILVVLDHWFGLSEPQAGLRQAVVVSILVVLDHWFGQEYLNFRDINNPSFNPCCFGSLVRATKIMTATQLEDIVSILVVLDHWFGLVARNYARLETMMFQSLLFWIIGSGL